MREEEFIDNDEYLEQFGKVICITEAQSLINKSKNITADFLWYLNAHPDYEMIDSGDEVVYWMQGTQKPSRYPAVVFEYPSSKINAFALPGGFMFITSGLLKHFQNGNITRGEMAFLLSHEFTHARAGHGFSQRSTGILATIFMTAAYIFARNSDNKYVRDGVPFAAAIISILVLCGISQDDENFADAVATRETIAMGYPANSGITLLQKISGDQNITGTNEFDNRCYFKTHPGLNDRIQNIQETADSFDNSIYSYFPQPATYATNNNPNVELSQNGVTVIKINAIYTPPPATNTPSPTTNNSGGYNVVTATPPTTSQPATQVNSTNNGYNLISPSSPTDIISSTTTTNQIIYADLQENQSISGSYQISFPFYCKSIKLFRTDSGHLVTYIYNRDSSTIDLSEFNLPSGTKLELTINTGQYKNTKIIYIK